MSCRQLVSDLNVLPVPCMYISEIIYQLKVYVEKLEQNTGVYNHNTHQKLNLHVQFFKERCNEYGS
jgi:hypothetical protein